MAIVRRRFVGSILIDAVLTSYIVLAGLLHTVATDTAHRGSRGEMSPFVAHIGHGFIGLFGVIGIYLSSTSVPSRSLKLIAPLAFIGDFVAILVHTVTLTTESDSGGGSAETAVYTLLSSLLAVSTINVYWASSNELKTFGTLLSFTPQ